MRKQEDGSGKHKGSSHRWQLLPTFNRQDVRSIRTEPTKFCTRGSNGLGARLLSEIHAGSSPAGCTNLDL